MQSQRCQGRGRGFESLRPLQIFLKNSTLYADGDGANSASLPRIFCRGIRGEAVGSVSWRRFGCALRQFAAIVTKLQALITLGNQRATYACASLGDRLLYHSA